LYAAIRTNDLTRLAALLDQGVDANAIDVADTRKISPLSNAAAIGSLEAMEILVAHKANVSAQDGAGSTALIWGVRDIAKVRFLLEHGADPNRKTRRGQTALMGAATSPDHSLDIVRALLEKGADVQALNADGHNSLHEAAGAGNTQVVALLLEKGLDINAKTTEPTGGFTPLILAAQNGNTELIRLLIAKGADVNAATPRDNPSRVKNGPIDVGAITALGVASTFGPPSVVKALLDAGANVNAQDIRGMTPLMLAI
jgi:cytohesin